MTLVAGRMPSLHLCGEDTSTQGILKSGPTRRLNRPEAEVWQTNNVLRSDDGKRLVRFCEIDDDKGCKSSRLSDKEETQDVIRFGNSTYTINSSDPNSAVRKLFPNSKLTPINPFMSRSSSKERVSSQILNTHSFENNCYSARRANPKIGAKIDSGRSFAAIKDSNLTRKSMQRLASEAKSKACKSCDSATPLIERIKQLTCESEDLSSVKNEKESQHFKLQNENGGNFHVTNYLIDQPKMSQPNTMNLAKPAKEGMSLMSYNQNISHSRSQPAPQQKIKSSNKTDEARRTFLSSLAQPNNGTPGDRTSVATNSSTAETVYSLSDIEEALTDEEKEIKDAFSQEIKQDELELFVQQDASRTERLRKRYSSTPKPDAQPTVKFACDSFHTKSQNPKSPYFLNDNATLKKEKPKFGSTIEILQQLQQQIETPYQLEGRRTACSNYSDSSIPISDRLFGDESSDGYEPITQKPFVHRTCSLDSKTYEDIENFPSAFYVPRTKSQEHPRLTYIDSEPFIYAPASVKHSRNLAQRNQLFEPGLYASSPNLNHCQSQYLDRVSSYNNRPTESSFNPPVIGRQLHPILQRQYCRYPVNDVHSSPVEEGKVLTPPVRMHTYMNVPNNAPCYLSPPPYSPINNYTRPPSYNEVYKYNMLHNDTSIYQNIPMSINPNLMTMRRLCTERERGVPEGASSTSEVREIYPQMTKDVYPPNFSAMSKPSSYPHQYCVDV